MFIASPGILTGGNINCIMNLFIALKMLLHISWGYTLNPIKEQDNNVM